ncbi:hypothetical protein [Thermotoga sp. KOL6]|uniref:hypothetical protein n=1 Tax=Thermotoga sp. KOL6 TaxID=126741 RepID=UPI000C759AD4|nr:hypothetical protein [Thermotoga sp. KOL6]PLV58322.1 hypothetical protein AS005_08115 [Thermotoga sp. KOL6]
MKYFSRSPEEWKKIDEEKERRARERRDRIRRRANLIVALNFVIVIFLFFFTKIFFTNKPSGVVGPFQIVIESKESYLPNDSLDVKVKIYNRENRKEKLEIEDFLFVIKKENNTVYEFQYPPRVERELDRFESVLVFDLLRETELGNLAGGDYTITVSMKLNGQKVFISKVVTVIEEWRLEIGDLKDFYFPYENIEMSIFLENISFKNRKIEVKTLSLVGFENGNKIIEKDVPIEKVLEVRAMETVELYKVNFSAPRSPGDYLLELNLETSSGIMKRSVPISIAKTYQEDLHGLTLVVEGERFLKANERYDFSVKLLNNEKKRKYIILTNVLVVITKKEPVFSYSISEEHRIVLDGFSSRKIFETTAYDLIKFDEPGTYKLVVIVESEKDRLIKEMEIVVSE